MRWKIFGIFLCLLVAAGMGISCSGSREAKAVSGDPALSSEDIRNRIYDSIPLQEVEEVLQDMKEDEVDFSIREYVDRVLAGEGELSLAGMESYVRNYIVHQFEANRKTFLRLILFGILSGVFLNFSSTMYEKQMGETGFQIIYFLVVTIMVTGNPGGGGCAG